MGHWVMAAGGTVCCSLAALGCGSGSVGDSDGSGAAAGALGAATGGSATSMGGGATGSASGGSTASGGSSTDPAPLGEPCGEGWGSDPIPGSVDLGLASSPEIRGVDRGTADERAIFDQINAERANAGLAPLQWSDQVANVARSHAADMNQLDYFDHGSSVRPYVDDAGQTVRENWLPLPRIEFVYPGTFSRAGENIAMTGDPVGNAVQMWMGSDGHRAAILDEYGWTATHGAIGIDDRMVVFDPAVCASN